MITTRMKQIQREQVQKTKERLQMQIPHYHHRLSWTLGAAVSRTKATIPLGATAGLMVIRRSTTARVFQVATKGTRRSKQSGEGNESAKVSAQGAKIPGKVT